MNILRRLIKWCNDLNDSPLGDILVWVFFLVDFAALWLITYMIAG